jgi:hypothetical protein
MTAWRQAIELSIGYEDVARLITITRSRTEPASRVERARMLLAYREDCSWLNLVEGFFSKLARSVLRHIRVTSKQELKDRLMAAMDHFNQDPVVHTWSYKLDQAA